VIVWSSNIAYNDLKICELADLELHPVDLQQR